MFVRLVLISLLLLAVPGWSQDRAALLTLEEAISTALANNRQLQNADLELSKFDDRLAATRAQRLPVADVSLLESSLLTRLDFEFQEGAFGNFAATGPIPSSDMAISTPRRLNTFIVGSVTQPLSHLYRINLSIRSQTVGRDIAREDVRLRRLSIASEVTHAYYALLETQDALEAHAASLTLHREVQRLAADSVLQQVALKADGLEADVRLARAEHEGLVLQNALVTQQQRLNHLMGRDARIQFVAVSTGERLLEVGDAEAMVAEALATRPEVVSARLRAEQAELERRLKRADYLPDVSLRVSYLSPFNIELLPKNIVSAGLFVSWQPLDWGRRGSAVNEAAKGIAQAKNSVEELESAIRVEVLAAHRNVRQALSLLRVTALACDTARENLRTATNRVRAEAALLRELLQAQATLADADAQHQQALLAYGTAVVDLLRAIGKEPS